MNPITRSTIAIALHPATVRRLLAFVVGAAMLSAGCTPADQPVTNSVPVAADAVDAEQPSTGSTTQAATYSGSDSCRGCHQMEWQAWRNSHHDLALQEANAETVLADFNQSHAGISFDRDADGSFTITPGADADALDVVYTFGVDPLQQYVIALPSGQHQVIPIPWDTRSDTDPSARFYELYPGDYPEGDPMHWRGRANNWNGMCADCHSTAVTKGFDPETGRYETRFAEEDVACEACHGPGSVHVADASSGSPSPLPSIAGQTGQINLCAQCHSRRSQLAEGFTAAASFFDHYLPSLLRPGLYYPDGQIRDEVYVYGSFLQSPMHLKGVTCSNCHDPHSAELLLPDNAVCTQCHNPQGRDEFASLKLAAYDDESHHHHPKESAGAACVNCHMTSTTYMGVDDRRDHSFRIPRPDLAESLGTPDACTNCHATEDPAELVQAFNNWFPDQPRHYGETFSAADRSEPQAEAELAALAANPDVPIMVRASAIARLAGYNRGYTLETIRRASRSEEPLLRLGAIAGATSLSTDAQWRYLLPLLDDEHLAIRNAAFSALVPLVNGPEQTARLQPFFSEYLTAQELTRDFPETLVNIANAQLAMGDLAAAEKALDEALRIQSSWVPALLNLADLYRATLRDPEGRELMLRALEAAPDLPETSYSYALWLTRDGDTEQALEFFLKAASVAPDQLRYGYALAIALNDLGHGNAAVDQLESMLERWPENEQLLTALLTILRDLGRNDEALKYLGPLLERHPEDRSLRTLELQLRAQMS